MLPQAIFLYVWYEFPKQGRTPKDDMNIPAMQRGVDDKVLLAMLRERVSAAKMQRICDVLLEN